MVGEEEKKEGCGKAKQRAQTQTLTGQVALEPGTHHRPYLHESLPTSTLHNHHHHQSYFFNQMPNHAIFFLGPPTISLASPCQPPIVNFFFFYLPFFFSLIFFKFFSQLHK